MSFSCNVFRAAFFHGQVEQPVRGLMSLVNHKDISVIIAINERGVFIIDPLECVSMPFVHYYAGNHGLCLNALLLTSGVLEKLLSMLLAFL